MDGIRFKPADDLTRAMMLAAERALVEEEGGPCPVCGSRHLDGRRHETDRRSHEAYTSLEPASRDFNPRAPFVIEGVTYRLEDGAHGISTLWRDAYFADEDPRGVMVENFAQSWHPMAVYLAAYRSRVRIAEIMRASE